jgi:predicted transcriptional regulator
LANLCPLRRFGFLTNHGLALLCIAENPGVRMRDIAAQIQITERAAQRIVADLIEAGYLDRERVGRRNRYTIQTGLPILLPTRRDVDLNSLLNVLVPNSSSVEAELAAVRADTQAEISHAAQQEAAARRERMQADEAAETRDLRRRGR